MTNNTATFFTNISLAVRKLSNIQAEVDIIVTIQDEVGNNILIEESELKDYDWFYLLEDTEGNIVERKISLISNQQTLIINDLLPIKTYFLNILAKNGNNVVLNSPKILFTTKASNFNFVYSNKLFINNTDLNSINKIYVRINNNFKLVKPYIMK